MLLQRLFLLGLLLVSVPLSANSEKPRRVYVDMVADLFHYGHMAFLEKAKEHGDVLVVGVCSDEDVMSYKRRPVMSLRERARAVKGCRFVDEVIEGCPLIATKEFLQQQKIDVVVHGDDFDQDTIQYFYHDAIEMGIFRTVPYTRSVSTTDIIRRIIQRADELDPDAKREAV